jgi:uracil-DNA glycosylase family 4
MEEGFFTQKETQSISRPDGKKYTCAVCGLYKTAENPRIEPFGNFKKKIMNVGTAPSEADDRHGVHWQGKTGKYLASTYESLGIDLFDDCINVTACHCRPVDKDGEDREPTSFEVECCRRTTLKLIEQYKPKVVILLGEAAIYSVIGSRWQKELGKIGKWRGWCIPDLDLNTWICPVFHPYYIELAKTKLKFNEDICVEETIWLQDLKEAFERLTEPLFIYPEPKIEFIDDLSCLKKIKTDIAFDYETTGLKPHQLGHKIICCSVADSENHAYVFMMPKSRKALQPFIDLLANSKIGKIASNMKFEETWSTVKLRQPVANWIWDTMIMSHVMDNRQGITSVKFQAYVQLGVIDYSSEIAPYLGSKKEDGGNTFNRIEKLLEMPKGKEKLMRYCAFDSIYEYRVAMKQKSMLI